jgi:hypothetical protein
MNIKEIIDKERWLGQRTLDGAYDYQVHNESLHRIEAAVNEHIVKLEAQVPEVVIPKLEEDDFGADYFCDCGVLLLYPQNYCCHCGSKLNWEEI